MLGGGVAEFLLLEDVFLMPFANSLVIGVAISTAAVCVLVIRFALLGPRARASVLHTRNTRTAVAIRHIEWEEGISYGDNIGQRNIGRRIGQRRIGQRRIGKRRIGRRRIGRTETVQREMALWAKEAKTIRISWGIFRSRNGDKKLRLSRITRNYMTRVRMSIRGGGTRRE